MSALSLAVVSRPPWRQPSVKARRLASPARAHDMLKLQVPVEFVTH